jgi:hypothetical protein
MQQALTETPPPFGMYFVNIEEGNIQQWNGFGWSVVAEHQRGAPTLAPGQEPDRERNIGWVGGGSGVSPAPKAPGDPSITDAMSGSIPTVQLLPSTFDPAPPAPFNLNAGAEQTIFTCNALPASMSTVPTTWQAIAILSFSAGILAGQTVTYRMKKNGVTVQTISRAGGPVTIFSEFIQTDHFPGDPWLAGQVLTVTGQTSAGLCAVVPQLMNFFVFSIFNA